MKRGAGPGVLTGIILVVGGFLAGAFAYAWLGPYREAVDPYVQGALVAGLAAIVAALLAIVGSWWGSSTSSEAAVKAAQITASAAKEEGAAARDEARQQAVREQRAELVGRIVTTSSRHADEVMAQVVRRHELAGTRDDSTIPTVGSTAPIQEAVNRLYALGSQHLADVGGALLNVLFHLDHFAYVVPRDKPGGRIRALTPDESHEQNVLQAMQKAIKTELMIAGSTEVAPVVWVPEGTLGEDYLDRQRAQAIHWVEAEQGANAPWTTTRSLLLTADELERLTKRYPEDAGD